MKKLLKTIGYFSFMLISVLIVSASSIIPKTYAYDLNGNAEEYVTSSSNSFNSIVNSILNEYSVFTNRIAGSEGETQAYKYIENYLIQNTNLTPLSNNFIENGVQSFRFQSIFDGEYYTSQNLIYEYKSPKNTDKKIIIGCSYDAVAYKYVDYELSLCESESINGSAGSVALMLALSRLLDFESLPYNVEFVFFGAGTSDNAGSKFYTQGISEETAQNILLMINVDKIAVGKNLYFYVDEIENDFSKFMKNLSKSGNSSFRQVSVKNLGKNLESDPIGLGYSHIALTSNNSNFMNSNILTMNIFAGDYSKGINLGICEYQDEEALTFTSNDNLEYIDENLGEFAVLNNLQKAFDSIKAVLSNENFVGVCNSSKNQTNWIYNIFSNKNLIEFLTGALIILLLIVTYIISYKLTKKSYFANIENDFVNSVMTISTNLENGQDGKTDIPDMVTDILVSDIKNDKQIKRKRNKKNDK